MPENRNELGVILTEYANSCTDMSDGLLDSLRRITEKSNLGAIIKINEIKISNELNNQIKNGNISWQDVLSYGDDYELFFTVDQKKSLVLKNLCKNIGIEIYEIGSLAKDKNINFQYNNKFINIDVNKKFEHFKK